MRFAVALEQFENEMGKLLWRLYSRHLLANSFCQLKAIQNAGYLNRKML